LFYFTGKFFMHPIRVIALIIVSMIHQVNAETTAKLTATKASQIKTMLAQIALPPHAPASFNVFFGSDSGVITSEYQLMLSDLVQQMSQHNKFQLAISVIGHTDSLASAAYNMALGQRRANAVKQALTPKLGQSFMISNFMSRGENRPTADNTTALGRSFNRRVEILVERPGLGHPSYGQPVSLSPAGKAALIREDGNLVLWNIEAQCPQSLLLMSADQVMSSTISADNRLALSGDSLGQMKLWDMATATELWSIPGHDGPISAVAFSPFDDLALSGSWDHQLKLWDLKSKAETASFIGHSKEITAVALGFNGRLALSGDTSGELILWDLAGRKVVKRLAAHQAMISAVAFTSDMRYAISSGMDKRLLVWDLRNDTREYIVADNASPVTSFDISANNQHLLASYSSGQIVLWQIKTKKQQYTLNKAGAKLVAVSYYEDDKLIMGSDTEHNIHFWDAKDGRFIRTVNTNNWSDKHMLSATDIKSENWTDSETGMSFSWVAPGCYDMGCGAWDNACSDGEKPVHEVCLDGFWMAQNEVNQQLWSQIMGYNPSTIPLADESAVNQVSWHDSQLFVCKLNQLTGQIYQLPAEAQWEYACRNGGEKISYGNEILDMHDKDPEKISNDLGLYNMNRGVWEWTLDAYKNDSYKDHRRHNPLFSGDDSYHFLNASVPRVERGGAWNKGKSFEQCSRRQNDAPGFRGFYTGLRLVKPQLTK
jgi:WD40 repeat protein